MNLGCGERRKSSHPHQTKNTVAITNSFVPATYWNSFPYVAILALILSAQGSQHKAARDQFSISAPAMVQSVLLISAGCILNPPTGHQLVGIRYNPLRRTLLSTSPFHTQWPESINISPYQTLLPLCPAPQYHLPHFFSWTHHLPPR